MYCAGLKEVKKATVLSMVLLKNGPARLSAPTFQLLGRACWGTDWGYMEWKVMEKRRRYNGWISD